MKQVRTRSADAQAPAVRVHAPLIKQGGLYEISMRHEPEFGGPVRILKASATKVSAAFEFDGELDMPEDPLMFRACKGKWMYTEKRSAFGQGPVTFKKLKEVSK